MEKEKLEKYKKKYKQFVEDELNYLADNDRFEPFRLRNFMCEIKDELTHEEEFELNNELFYLNLEIKK